MTLGTPPSFCICMCLEWQALMLIPREMLLYNLSEKAKLLFPFLLWAALNIISNEYAKLVTGVSQCLLISKPACITVNISFLYFCMKDQNDESWLVLLWSRKDLVLGQESLTTLPNIFFNVLSLTDSLTHSLGKLEFIITYHCINSSAQLEALGTWSCGIRRRLLERSVLELEFRTGVQLQKRVQIRKPRSKHSHKN